MVLKLLRVVLMVAAVSAAGAWVLGGSPAAAHDGFKKPGDLFYNYYVPPDPRQGVGAQLYVSPRPTPPVVGHTYITYQPLMPHEFLYPHYRVYWRHLPEGQCTRTFVGWW